MILAGRAAVIVVIAFLLAAATVGCGSSKEDKAGQREGACKLTAATLVEIVGKLDHGSGTGELLESVAPGLEVACQALLKSMVAHPTRPFDYEFDTGSSLVPRTITLDGLTATPTTSAPPAVSRQDLDLIIACAQKWNSQVLVDLCVAGDLPSQ